ncbi:MAG: EAL domain-containing protein, partial [Ketobacteraceae bacterium]|nr:EAL domain-containing protein [Ketobacteraceae bacterium]
DDFGTGYSSLSHLKHHAADIIKLDKSFLNPSDRDNRHNIVLERVIDLCLALEYQVLAEGVENPEQYQRAVSFGCQSLQGFHIHTPQDLQSLVNDYKRQAYA